MHDLIGLKESVQRVRRSRFALAPTAVAGVNNERGPNDAIPDTPARASSFPAEILHAAFAARRRKGSTI
jgi:hypothetical protein